MPETDGQEGRKKRVLLAAKDDAVIDRVMDLLSRSSEAFDLGIAATLADATGFLDQYNWDVCLADPSISDRILPAVIEEITLVRIELPVIILADEETLREAEALEHSGAADVLSKQDLSPDILRTAIHYAQKNQSVRSKLRASKDYLIKQLLSAQGAVRGLQSKGEEHATLVAKLAEARGRADENESRYDRLIERTTIGIWQIAVDGRTQFMNPAMHGFFELDEDKAVADKDHQFLLEEEGRAAFRQVRAKWLRREEASCEVAMIGNQTERVLHGVVSGGVLLSAEGKVTGLLASIADISERKEAEERIRHLAGHDTLTGLPNRALFLDRLQQAISAAEREGREVAVLFLDLDHFKEVNDTLGHPIGDQLLVHVARRLTECTRRADTVARFGGDEFAFIANAAEQPLGATILAARILESLSRPFDIEQQQIRVSTSIGITVAPTDGCDPDKLLRNADLALYRAKDKQRGTHQFFNEQMDKEIRIRKSLEHDLAQAIEQEQLSLHFQPQMHLKSGKPVCVEALLRWNHPTRGEVRPAEFIHLAESTGMIVPIGDWVLRNACREATRWDACGLPQINISVNMSPVQFRKQTLINSVTGILQEFSLLARRLELEVTEGLLMDDAPEVIKRLEQLRRLGITISIDDFGTGYSSLAYLRKLPVDKLKIDQSFIRDICTEPHDAAIARTVIHLAHSLRMQVVAEGVETADQLSILRTEKCDEAQGFYVCHPLPAAEFAQWLSQYADDPAAASQALKSSSTEADPAEETPPLRVAVAQS